jgi:hypothetical protein
MTSVIFGADQRLADFDLWLEHLRRHSDRMSAVGVRHVVIFRCLEEPNRVFLTVGVHSHDSIEEFLRSGAILEWLDLTGDEDLPPIFAGHIVEKLDLQDSSPAEGHPGVIVGSIGRVDSLPSLTGRIHQELDRFREAGVRRFWTLQALDDPAEVMLMQELTDESHALRWIEWRQRWAAFVAGPGAGVYPSIFIGRLAQHMAIPPGV